MKFLKLTAVAVAATVLSGCSIFGDDEITYKELQPINATVTPQVQWTREVGDGVGDFFSRLNPIVVGERVIAADRRGVVAAFERNSGQPAWRVDVRTLLGGEEEGWLFPGEPLRISGGLTSGGNRIFFGTENGQVIALNPDNGELLWHTEVKGEVLADPAVGDGFVVVQTGSGNIVGLDERTGEEQWTLRTEVPALTLRGTSAPIITNGGALFGTATGKLSVAVLENGQQAWEARLAVPKGATELQRLIDVDSKPVVYGSAVYAIAYNGQVASVELNSGRVIWQREYSSFQNIDIGGGRLYLTDVDDSVYALDPQGGVEVWSNNDLSGRELTAPVRYKNTVVVGDRFGYLHFLNASNGELIGRLEMDDEAYVAPIVSGDTLYVQLRDGSLLAVGI
ncbi:outer membrane protein assembly factor BamB [Pseudidiomarina aestuarii]|uniref:Outer membrane protein assembly factor BamB n=1 Tax=Pseudidiomarina aestuarii TaxID=624146 RepID=A0A7Z7EUC8_9GAMM|nr:outer membrane protein assembly factor BamB [Pseudidiomarina aestuarii]RUO41679.1 outer membrane protein assembly factor BamB [Pseudidiomarina aestuarii]